MFTDDTGRVHEIVYGVIAPADIDAMATQKGYVSKTKQYFPERPDIFNVYNKMKIFIHNGNMSIVLVKDMHGGKSVINIFFLRKNKLNGSEIF